MNSNHLKETEIENVEEEVNSAIDSLIAGCEALDMESAFGMFSDSTDFLMMGTDGTLCDYKTYVRNNVEYLNGCERFTLKTHSREIRVLDQETAVFSWAYGVEAKLKTGGSDFIDKAGASFVFRKIRGIWKVVYYHESSVPPERIGA